MRAPILAAALACTVAACASAPVAYVAGAGGEVPAGAGTGAAEPAVVVEARPAVEVVVGAFAFDGNWYQDGSTHEHELVALSVRTTARGLDVRIGRAKDYGNTDLTLSFERDDDGRTIVTPNARWFTPRRKQGRVESGELADLRGFVQMQFEDWSPGNALNCRFALLGTDRSRTILLSGAFLVRNPPR